MIDVGKVKGISNAGDLTFLYMASGIIQVTLDRFPLFAWWNQLGNTDGDKSDKKCSCCGKAGVVEPGGGGSYFSGSYDLPLLVKSGNFGSAGSGGDGGGDDNNRDEALLKKDRMNAMFYDCDYLLHENEKICTFYFIWQSIEHAAGIGNYVNIKINGVDFCALADTGARMNVITGQLLDRAFGRCNSANFLAHTTKKGSLSGFGSCPATYIPKLLIEIDTNKGLLSFFIETVVVESRDYELPPIIGLPFFSAMQASFDFKNSRITGVMSKADKYFNPGKGCSVFEIPIASTLIPGTILELMTNSIRTLYYCLNRGMLSEFIIRCRYLLAGGDVIKYIDEKAPFLHKDGWVHRSCCLLREIISEEALRIEIRRIENSPSDLESSCNCESCGQSTGGSGLVSISQLEASIKSIEQGDYHYERLLSVYRQFRLPFTRPTECWIQNQSDSGSDPESDSWKTIESESESDH